MWIAADEEAEIATAIRVGAASSGAGATFDIPAANRPLGRTLAAGRLRTRPIEPCGNSNAANQAPK